MTHATLIAKIQKPAPANSVSAPLSGKGDGKGKKFVRQTWLVFW